MMGQRARRIAIIAALQLALVTTAPTGAGARETRHLDPGDGDLWNHDRGYSLHPCAPVVLEPNVTAVPPEHHQQVRNYFQVVADVYNAMIGRSLFTVGSFTTRASRVNDGHHVFEVTVHGDPAQGIGASRYASGRARPQGTGTVDGGLHITDMSGEFDIDMNSVGLEISVDTMIHEIGHGLGFHHTIDGRSTMSYNFDRRSRHDDIMDLDKYGEPYVRAVRHFFPADCAYATLGEYPTDWRKGGPTKRGNNWFFGYGSPHSAALTDGVTSVVDIGADLLDGVQGAASRSQPDPTPRDRIIVCRDDVYADCLGGAALAGTTGAIVFVQGGPDGHLGDRVRDAMVAQVDPGTEVILLGGVKAVSQAVEDELRTAGFDAITRIFGANRYATAAAVATRVLDEAGGGTPDLMFLARGNNYADAVASSAWAARVGAPILLTDNLSLHPETAAWMDAHRPGRTLVVGGGGVISDATSAAAQSRSREISRAFGRNRRATSVALAQHPWVWNRAVVTTSSRFYLVNGFDDDHTWALALAAAPWAASEQAAILLTSYGHLGFVQDGSDGTTPDPGWYFWNLDATTASPEQGQFDGFVSLGTPQGTFTEPDLVNSAQLTATAKATYAADN